MGKKLEINFEIQVFIIIGWPVSYGSRGSVTPHHVGISPARMCPMSSALAGGFPPLSHQGAVEVI